jgi:hypothetical protein
MKSLARAVADEVISAGMSTVQDLQPKFPRVAYMDLLKAAHNAHQSGFIRVAKRGRGKAHPTVWEAGRVPVQPRLKVASVFELGNPKPETAWPKANGTVYRPLGGWSLESDVCEQEAA